MCGQCPKDDFIGQTFPTPKGGVLTVVGVSDRRSGNNKVYKLTCSICSEDKELFPDLFESTKSGLGIGAVPCGCAFNPKYKESNYKVLVKRITEQRNIKFNGWSGEYKNGKTYLKLSCKVCFNEWNSTSISKLLTCGKGCPKCVNDRASKRMALKDFEERALQSCVDKGLEFVDFPNGYDNQNSKMRYLCDLHGIKESTFVNFVNNGTGCPDCGIERRADKQRNSDAETIAKELCDNENYGYIGFPDGYKTNHSKFEYICPTHGKQTVSYSSFVNNGTRCPGCGFKHLSNINRNSDAETIVKTICEEIGYGYIGFPDGYKTNHSKFEYICPTHGKHIVSYVSFVNNGSRCPGCAGNVKLTGDVVTSRIISVLKTEKFRGHKLVGFPDGYKNARSKVKLWCPVHDHYETSYSGLVHSGRSCPSCAEHGYQPSKPGEIYFTFWTDPDHKATTEDELFEQSDVNTKIGITNKRSEERTNQQSRKTKLVPNNMLTMRFEDGRIPQILEDMTKSYRQKVDINTGYGEYISKEEFEDGYTEILGDYYGFNEVLPLMIDYIKEQNLTPEVTVGKKLFDKLMKVKKHSTMWGYIQEYKDNFYKTIKSS